jgi:hypothetical protein
MNCDGIFAGTTNDTLPRGFKRRARSEVDGDRAIFVAAVTWLAI